MTGWCEATSKPSQPLAEVALAEELETSRVTVRVALRELADRGLVEIVPYRGAFVSELTSRMARETFRLRAVLESYKRSSPLRTDHYPKRYLKSWKEHFRTSRLPGTVPRI